MATEDLLGRVRLGTRVISLVMADPYAGSPEAYRHVLRVFHADRGGRIERQDPPAPWRLGSAAIAAAWQPADPRDVESRGAPARRAFHGDRTRPARLRRLVQARGDQGSCALFQACDGAGCRRGDA